MWWGGGDQPPPDGDGAGSSGGPQAQREAIHQLKEQMAAQQELLGSLRSKLPHSSSNQEYSTRLAAMRNRIARPSSKQNKTGVAKTALDDVTATSERSAASHLTESTLTTESVTVDPSAAPFEVVHRSSSIPDEAFQKDVVTLSTAEAPAALSSVAAPVAVDSSFTKKARTASFSEGSTSSNISKPNMKLLRKQMDESRSKYEKQQRDNKEKKANMDEMKKKIEKMRSELEERDELIQNFEKGIIPQHSQTTTQQLCQQLLQKDAIVLSLTSRVNELESLCQEQKESIEEKESLINARTEAVSLVTKDRDEKFMKMVDDLQEKEETIRNMIEEFKVKEGTWLAAKESMEKEMAEKTGRVSMLEENCRRIENIRFELSTRNAEMQEKIVTLQTERISLEENITQERSKCSEKLNLIEELEKKLSKAEAFGAKKLKGLEKQIKAMKQPGDDEAGKNILDLHNQIALLEEEKGNLQLQILNYDDLKLQLTSYRAEETSMREKCSELYKEIENLSASISALESEKIKLVDILNERDVKYFNLETNIIKLEEEKRILKLDNSNLKSKVEELESKLELMISEDKPTQSEDTFKDEFNNYEVQINELKMTLQEKNAELESLKQTCCELENNTKKYKELCQQAEKIQLETSEANQRLLAILTDKEDSLTNQAIEIDKNNELISTHAAQVEELNTMIAALKCELETKTLHYERVVCKLQELTDANDKQTEELKEKMVSQEDTLCKTVDENKTLRGKLEDIKGALDEAEHELRQISSANKKLRKLLDEEKSKAKRLVQELEELRAALDKNETELKTNQIALGKSDKKIQTLVEERDALTILLSEMKEQLTEKTEMLTSIQDELSATQNTLKESERRYGEQLTVYEGLEDNIKMTMEDHTKELKILNDQLENKTTENNCMKKQLNEIEIEIQEKNSRLLEVQESIDSYIAAVREKDARLTAQDNINSSLSLEVEQLKETKETMNLQIRERDQLHEELKAQLHNEREQVASFKTQLEEKQRSLEELVERLQASESTLKATKDHAVLLSSTATDMEAQLNAERAKLSEASQSMAVGEELQLQLNLLQESKKTLEETVATLEQRDKELQQTIECKANEYEELKNNFHQLTEWYEQVNVSAATLQQSCGDLQQQLEEKSNAVGELQNRIQDKERAMFEVSQQLEEKNKLIQDLEEKLQDALVNNESFNEAVKQKENEINELSTELSDLNTIRETNTCLQQELQDKDNRILELQQLTERYTIELKSTSEVHNELFEKQKIIGEMKHELDTLKNELCSSTQLRMEIEEKQNRILQLEQQLEETSQSLEAKTNELLLEKEQIQQQMANLNKTDSDNTEVINCLKNEAESLQCQLTKLTTQLNETNEKYSALSEEHSKLTTEWKAVGELRQQLSNELQALKEDHEHLRTSNEELILKCSSLETELEGSKEYAAGVLVCQQQWEEWSKTLEVQKASLEQQLQANDSQTSFQDDNQDLLKTSAQLTAFEQEKESLQSSISSLTSELETLKQQLMEQNIAKEGLERIVLSKDEALQALSTEMQDKREKEDEHLQKLSEVNKELFDKSTELCRMHEELQQKELVISQVNEKLRYTEDSLLELQAHSSSGSNTDALTEECNLFRHQLDEALIKITQLETSLATAVASKDDDSGSINMFGEVDLRSDSSVSSSPPHTAGDSDAVLRLQQTLAEKTELVASMQDELRTLKQNLHSLEEELRLSNRSMESMRSELNSANESRLQLEDNVKQLYELKNSLENHNVELRAQLESVQTTHQQQLQEQLLLQRQQYESQQLSNTQHNEQLMAQVTALQQELETLKSLHETIQSSTVASLQSAATDGGVQSEGQLSAGEIQAGPPADVSSSATQLSELQYKVSWYEEQWNTWTEHYNVLQQSYTQLQEENSVLEQRLLQQQQTDGNEQSSRETQQIVVALQKELEELREAKSLMEESHKVLLNEVKVKAQETECQLLERLATAEQQSKSSAEMFGSPHQQTSSSSISTGRVTELELMVQSAEAEISRLKGHILQLQDEQVALNEQLSAASESSASGAQSAAVLDHLERENLTLRSELEVMEGENSRRSTDVDILESENNRLRTEMEMLQQSVEMLEAQKESLLMQIQEPRATEEQAPETQLIGEEDELDWGSEGTKEVEHLQRSASQDPSLIEEVRSLKQQLIDAEKEKNTIAAEVQSSKVKCGKLLQKVKTLQSKNDGLQKEVERLKSKKGGGLTDLDQALEDEFKAQVQEAHKERDELKQRLEEVLREKDSISEQCEVLKDSHDRFMELKENQDTEVRLLSKRNRELETTVNSMEWRISELEEGLEEQQSEGRDTKRVELRREEGVSVAGHTDAITPQQVKELQDQVVALENQLDELSSTNMKVESINKDLNDRLAELQAENDVLKREKEELLQQISSSNEMKGKLENDIKMYKDAFINQQEQFEKLTDEKSSLEKSLEEARSSERRITSEYDSLYTKNEDLYTSYVSLKVRNAALEEDIEFHEKQITDLQSQLDAFREADLDDSLRLLQVENDKLTYSYEQLKEQYLENVSNLKEMELLLESKNTSQETLGQTVAALREQLQKMGEQEKINNENWILNERMVKYHQSEVQAYKSKSEKLSKDLEEFKCQVEELSGQVQHWEQQSQHLSKQVESADASLSRLSGATTSTTELEAALASLHLRDLRCHQLIMEINKLVEERDALQLRLSSALRTNQELKRTLDEYREVAEREGSAAEEDIKQPSQDQPKNLIVPLKRKLEELRELNDVVEQKTLANVPPVPSLSGGLPPSPFTSHTAPVTPVPLYTPDLTLTRETQATSSTLMNWIMGRTTPKVMHV